MANREAIETVETVIARSMVWSDEPFEITDLGHEMKQASRIIAALDAAGFAIVPQWRVVPVATEQYAGQPEMPRQWPGNAAQEPSR